MESLIQYQVEIYERMTKGRVNFKKCSKDRVTKQYLEGRIELVDQQWAEFQAGHKELKRSSIYATELEKTCYVKNDIFDKGEEIYLNYKCELKTALAMTSNPCDSAKSSVPTKHSNVRLPKVNISKFSGNYSEWNTFRDLFTSLVHNNCDLDDVQKLLYLKGYLTGEAEQLLNQIPITGSNYSRCWELLESRYNNKRFICHNILKRLLGQKNISHESAKSIKELVDTTSDCLSALTNVGVKTENWDIMIIHLLVLKLDPESRRQWEFSGENNPLTEELPTYNQFREFLTKRYRALEFLDTGHNSSHKTNVPPINKMRAMHIVQTKCPFCSSEHKLNYCKAFSNSSVESRRSFVQSNNICFCCLGSNHCAKNCKSNFKCRICNKKHHALLHPPSEGAAKGHVTRTTSTAATETVVSEAKEPETVPVVSCFTRKINSVLLATALVNAMSKSGQSQTIRTMLDQGSQSSFVTEATVQQLGLRKTRTKIEISGVGGEKCFSKAMVTMKVQSRINPHVELKVNAYVLNSITSLLPSCKLEAIDWQELSDLVLADPEYETPNQIQVLLGAEVYSQILESGMKKSPSGTLVAQATSLGWILSGVVSSKTKASSHVVMHSCIGDDDVLKRFWELEADVPLSPEKMFTEEEKRCEQHFAQTSERDEQGRYVVRLPFKNGPPEVCGSMEIAEKRVKSLERRLGKDVNLKIKYREVINEYIELGHLEKIPPGEIGNPKAIYLPHHAVIRDDKETTKVRAVFDASCKGTNNISLNDSLLVGPTLQADLKNLVMRWRTSPICVTADIVKMYRQVKVDEADVDFQRILWRNDTNEDLKHFRMLRVTFGVASAPYLAVKALQQLSLDEGHQYPMAKMAVLNQFYMDDLLAGCQSVQEGITLYQEMNELLALGGFSLQKWTSNSEELLQKMKDRDELERDGNKENIKEGLKIKSDEVVKIVGLTWNRSDDSFRYKVEMPEVQEPATKRTIISNICRFYDPLGWVGPSIIVAKMFIQKLWLTGISWDETVPQNILQEWKTYQEELKLLSNVAIPRWIRTKTGEHVEIHGFSDASKDAYAAVVYARVIDSNGQIHVSLVAAKTKVAPIKQVSIPRLELCGAVLLMRLMMEIASVMNIDKSHLHAWTDSTVVLAWLNSHPNRWKVFVANRVSEIITNLDSHHWSHVSTKCNPADAASRGQNPSELVRNKMWFEGPDFLRNECIEYKKLKNVDTNIEEVKIKAHGVTVDDAIWERFSSLTRMIRVIAYCKRFVQNLKTIPSERRVGYLSTQELNDALNCSIRQCQSEGFSEEIAMVRDNQNLPKRSSLRALTPFLDNEQVLRVGGRLEHSPLNVDRKHPILIPKDSRLAHLIVADAHKQTLHGGPQLMLCYLQAKYWILGAKRLVKSCFRGCVTCVKNTGKTQTQLMGQLPSARTTPARPFKSSGVDYAGPIQIRTAKGRGHKSHKAYICIFVCMISRALHLEICNDLTLNGFLQAFKRFVARRGFCSDLWSDNAKTFVGAASELKKLFSYEQGSIAQDIAESLATNGCTWHFIPAHAPNFGGLWEAGVKSVKYHLKRTIGTSTLTFEEMSTVLAQIEACLNSRPLSVLTGNDDEELTILTPGHFLVGEALVTPPEKNYESSNVSSLRRWQYTQRMTQEFWRQWSRQYLNRFYKRHRWSAQMPQPRVGDVVVVREDNLPICRWLYGRVVATHPGQDNLIRVVTLKMKNGTVKRPVNKLCFLPVTE